MPPSETPICDYEGSDYQETFWNRGGRTYEDRVEAVALRRLLPSQGGLLLELGAGAGRNTGRYGGFERIVLLDYSLSQLEQAQARWGRSQRYVYVAADVYRLPFAKGLFGAATMVRVLHHMADAPRALASVRDVLRPGGVFVLEFANKQNLKAILRYWMGQQSWNPFSLEPVEFAELNFDFHPRCVRTWLEEVGLRVDRRLTVSHFRASFFKRAIPVGVLVFLDALLQPTGGLWELTPSVFYRTIGGYETSHPEIPSAEAAALFLCPECGHGSLQVARGRLICVSCGTPWAIHDGIYDFRHPVNPGG